MENKMEIMRQIKFRCWDVFNKVWCIDEIAYMQLVDQARWNPELSEYFTLSQFTGLKDKNGKEIYEGDIIQYKSYWVNKRWWNKSSDIPIINEECVRQREDISVYKDAVKFVGGSFVLNYCITLADVERGQKFEYGRSNAGDTESKQWDFEIIGNIYENPELCK